MKGILHIGTARTGTTSIQAFMHENRAALAARGVIYPRSVGLRNHRKLPVLAYDAARRDDFTRTHGLDTDQRLADFQAKTLAELRQELRRAAEADRVVLSSEHIHLRLSTAAELGRLRALLDAAGFDDVRVVVYLRRPADIARSGYASAVKFGSTAAEPRPPDHERSRTVCDHRLTIERFGAAFGTDRVTPRLYGRAEFVNGCLISDFLEAIGVSGGPAGLAMPPRHNASLSAVGIEIARRVNRHVPKFIDERPNRLREGLEAYLAAHLEAGRPYALPPALHRAYESAFAASNEWVRARYFADRPSLFPPKPAPQPPAIGLTDAELDRIADLIASVWRDKQTTIQRIHEQLTSRLARAVGRCLPRRAGA